MFEITYIDCRLAVSSYESFAPVVRNFLRSLGFSGDSKCMAVTTDKPYDVMVSSLDMVRMYGQTNMDANCKRILDDAEEAKQKFEEASMQAESLKSHDREYWEKSDLTVPKMVPDVSLKWYQKMCVTHAVTLGNAANFSVPGSGKTWMALSTFLKMKYERKEVDKLLVAAPNVAFRPWEIEYATMTRGSPDSIVRISGTPERRDHLFEYSIPNSDILLVSHAMAVREERRLTKIIGESRFMVIVDESHNIKRPDGQRAMALQRMGKYAEKRMILTGTPMPKSLGDLWAQFSFLYPNNTLFPSWPQYEYQCKSHDALEKISSMARPYFIRVSKDMLNLPQPEFNPDNGGLPTVVPMGSIQRRIYDSIALKIRDNVERFRDDVVSMERYRKNSMIYLIEAATDPALLTKDTTYQSNEFDTEGLDIIDLLSKYPRLKGERLGKLDTAARMASNTLDGGGKVIIWCSFINTIKKMSEYMRNMGHNSVTIWGGIPRDNEVDPEDNREARIERFKNDSACNILIANPSSLAESISLHKHCHHAIYVDRTFNGAHYMQSLDRIHRVGLEPNSKIWYDIIQSERSIDQTIHERLITKQMNMEVFLNRRALDVYATDDDEAPADASDGGYMADFDAAIKDMGRHVSL